LAIMAAAMLMGYSWNVSLAVGWVLSLSSTAIVLQTLNEKGWMRTEGGSSSFSVLLFQDIAVIPMLALIPLLAVPEVLRVGTLVLHDLNWSLASVEAAGTGEVSIGHAGEAHGAGFSLVEGLLGWQVALVNVAAIGVVIVGGMFLSRPLFRYIASSGLREVFTAATLLLVIGIALLMTVVGLSPALGTFLAGVVLANSEYRHELESDIEPFKGLLLGLFFITVGAGINFSILFGDLWLILALTVGVIAIKAFVMFLLSVLFGISGSDRWLFLLALAQAGEFGFVLISLSLQNAVLPDALAERLLLVVALSMLFTPLLFILFERFIKPRIQGNSKRADDEVTQTGTVIIAGHGRFGQVINRMLMSNGYKTVVLDHEPGLVDGLRKFGTEVFYGDASRPDLLHAAGLREAQLLVVAIDDKAKALELIAHARRERPELHIIARAYDRLHVYQLYKSGTDDIVRESFDSAVRSGRYALEALGMHPFESEKAASTYVDQDLIGIRRLAQVYREEISVFDNQEYMDLARQVIKELELAMQGRSTAGHDHSEAGWRPPGNTRLPEDS